MADDESWLEPNRQRNWTRSSKKLRSRLEAVYGERLKRLYLYGSYARGEARRGSDLDVLVVLDRLESSWDELSRCGHVTSERKRPKLSPPFGYWLRRDFSMPAPIVRITLCSSLARPPLFAPEYRTPEQMRPRTR